MTGVLYALLGGALVILGVLASAVADRVRGIRVNSKHPTSAVAVEPMRARPRPDPEVIRQARRAFESTLPGEHDVVAALVASGYKRAVAAEAARGCDAADRSTIESWTAAALRRAGKGAPS